MGFSSTNTSDGNFCSGERRTGLAVTLSSTTSCLGFFVGLTISTELLLLFRQRFRGLLVALLDSAGLPAAATFAAFDVFVFRDANRVSLPLSLLP
jgi:hypothetical protein